VRPGGVDTDAVHLRPETLEFFDPLSELGKLVRSTRRKVKNIRQQHDGAARQGSREADRLFASDRQLEVGSRIANRKRCQR
jgi:hypothetical protein